MPSACFSAIVIALAGFSAGVGRMVCAADLPATPRLELRTGERYFRAEGILTFILGRNPTGTSAAAMDEHFRAMNAAGERFARIHFTYHSPEERAGGNDPGMLKSIDETLDAAARHNVAVMPVLDVWANWNDGSNHELWHAWDKNAFNAARGGPAKRPEELFSDTPCRALWLERTANFVKHFAARREIVAWEFFSELDLVTGATEATTLEFARLASATIHAADPMSRPVAASLSGVNEWPKLFASDAVQFVEVHPYTGGNATGDLDELVLSSVRARLARYDKPVLIGECGLDFRPPRPPESLDLLPRARIGIMHAIWASVVSGAANGRMFWWHDGYDIYEKADLARDYQMAAAPAAKFVAGVDCAGMVPLTCDLGPDLRGAMLGNGRTVLGWFRDARCIAPDWPVRPLAGREVSLPAAGELWEVTLVDPLTGNDIGTRTIAPVRGKLQLPLPSFEDAIAVKLALRK